MGARKHPWRWRVALVILALGVYLASRAFWFEPQSLTIREMSIQTPDWKGPPVRVALLSDIHGDQFHMPVSRIKGLAQSIAVLKPDLVLLGGDYVGGHFAQAGLPGASRQNRTSAENAFEREAILALDTITAPLGVYAVMGNHDCWWDCDQVRALFQTTKIKLLENQSFEVKRREGSIWVVGIEDGQTQNADFEKANAGIPAAADTLTLVHNPGLFRWPSNQSRLQFSGHSHGGQVRFPLIGAPVRMSRYTEETAQEPLVIDKRILVVTTGVGEVGLPVRFGVPPEIALINIANGPQLAVSTKKRTAIDLSAKR